MFYHNPNKDIILVKNGLFSLECYEEKSYIMLKKKRFGFNLDLEI